MRHIILASVAVAMLATPIATAAASTRPVVKVTALKTLRAFRNADVDQNRALSSAEFVDRGGKPESFALLDLNDDGNVGYFELLRGAILRLRARFSAQR